MTAQILVVDDEPTLRGLLTELLRHEGYSVRAAGDSTTALAWFQEEPFDLVLTDVKMPSASGVMSEREGLDLLERIVRRSPGTPVIMITGHASIPSAVDAMRAGAADYITKPFRRDEIVKKVEAALERVRLRRAISERARADLPGSLAARSAAMRPVLDMIARCAASPATVLISGPPGSGKERVARAIHAASGLPAERFVAVRCDAMHDTLYEAELFGHEKGAFTGADRARRGVFEEADGGTLLLDGIEETPLALQSKLQPAIEKRIVRRIGGTRAIPITARIIATSAGDLRQRVRDERFRADLYYCLRVVRIELPALRERKEDVPELAAQFLHEISVHQRRNLQFEVGAVETLQAFDFPGNIRELRGLVESLATESTDGVVTAGAARAAISQAAGAGRLHAPVREVLKKAETDRIRLAVARHPGNLAAAARDLGVSRTTLWRRLSGHGLDAAGA